MLELIGDSHQDSQNPIGVVVEATAPHAGSISSAPDRDN